MAADKRKILSIIPYKIFPANLGGEKNIALFNKYLAKRISLTAVTVKSNDPQYALGYKVLNIISDSILRYINIFLYFRIRKIMKAERANYLLIEHPYYGWLAWMIKKSLNITWIIHSHNIEYMRSRSIGRRWWRALKWYEGWVYRHADAVFFISEEDRQNAIRHLHAPASKMMEATYGIERSHFPGDLAESAEIVRKAHGIDPEEKILLFNGALYHSTNYDALSIILDKINPFLLERKNFRYKILVCGKGLPASFDELKNYRNKNVIYAGFVDDISLYFKAAKVFLNPILAGGGVKTKAVEALSMNCTVISTELGAMGIRHELCGNKLHIVKAGQWAEFAELAIRSACSEDVIPDSFFQYYYWGNVIDRMVEKL